MSAAQVQIKPAAREQIRQLREQKEMPEAAVRVEVRDMAGRRYALRFVMPDEREPDDVVLEEDGVTLYLDPTSAARAEGATLDYVDDLSGSGFRLEIPKENLERRDPLAARVQALIDEHIQPGVAQHGGQVMLSSISEGRVYLEFGGGCQGCGAADVTLKEGIEKLIMAEIPEIQAVLDTTDHAAGTAPYIQPDPAP